MWDTTYRPKTFADVLGQKGTVQLLKARLKNGTALDTSYIFSGGSGQGKTTLARIFARAMLCENLNKEDPEPCNECESCRSILNDSSVAFSEQDAASQGGIDQIRRIVDTLPFAVLGAPKRIYLFDECHRMSKDAQDVLLKPLEERKMIGMFCTTEPEKVRGAIRSRCEEYSIRKVTREDIASRMKMILEAEKVEFEDDALLTVIDYCGGHVRDVVSRLEMIAQIGPVTLDSVRDNLNLSVITTYYQILLNLRSDTKKALQLVDQACDRVTAEEVAAGLSEAAMNAFRLANNLSADFSFTDKALATEVYSQYKNSLIKIAGYFLRSRYVTQVGLICDLTTLAYSGIEDLSTQVRMAAPVIPVSLPQPTSMPEAPAVAKSSTPEATIPTKATTPEPAHRASEAPPAPRKEPVVTTHVIGNLGSGDPRAMTELDTYVIPEKNPGKKNQNLINFGSSTSDDRSILTHAAWRRNFSEIWNRGASG